MQLPSTKKEWEFIAENFAMNWQFPNCIGVLDGSYFNNYKGVNNMVLSAVVGADYQFISIEVGSIARIQDTSVLMPSDIREVIKNANTFLPKEKIIGNGRKLPYVFLSSNVFPIQKHILTPYSHNTNQKSQTIFNMRLSRARHVVQHAIGILFNRFKIFQNKISLSVEKLELITKTCCILHNILSKQNDDYLNMTPSEVTDLLYSSSDDQWTNEDSRAELIRKSYEEYFNEEGKLPW